MPQPSPRDQMERAVLLLRRSRSFWKRALVVFVASVLLAVPFVFTRPRAYKSETVIVYQEAIRSTDLTGGEASSDSARRAGARLREVLLTRSSLEPIIMDLHLYTKHEGPPDRGELIEAVEEMRKHVTFRAREGDTFEISFIGTTPLEAQEVTRRLGDCIIQEAATRRSENAKTLKEFLDAESERNKVDLKQKEADFAKFVALHPVLAARLQGLPPTAGGAAPVPSSTASTSSDPVLASLEARAARLEHQLHTPSQTELAPPPPKPAPTFQPPPESVELVAAKRDLADKLARYTDKHPDVIAARNRLRTAEAAQSQLNEAALAAFVAQQQATRREQPRDEPTPNNTPVDEAALRRELAEIRTQIYSRRAVMGGHAPAPTVDDVADSPVGLEVEFRRLQREVNEGRDRQRQLEEKLFKASITASSVMNDRNIQVSILDPAYLPVAPVSKSRTLMLAALLALALALAVGTAILSAMMDDRLYDRIDIERLDILPVLGVIPKAHALPPRER